MQDPVILLSSIIFLPSAGALAIGLMPKALDARIKQVALAITVAVFLLTVWIALPGDAKSGTHFDVDTARMQMAFSLPWIPSFQVCYALGLDGISFPLVILTSFLSMLAMWASWPITKHIKAYCILFLLLETGMLGVFMALDFFLFYVFWEVMLLPMYFLIGIWGGPRREYAAIKFFLFTLAGSVLMLIAMLMLYFHSDVTRIDVKNLRPAERAAMGLTATKPSLAQAQKAAAQKAAGQQPPTTHTFNILAQAKLGQMQDSPYDAPVWGKTVQWWAFLFLLIGFLVKVPSVPIHTWLPDAHVEAPTPISMILAGVLLKMGGYGILRICYPICPAAGYELAWLVCGLGVVSMVYGAFAAMAQTDFKRLVAYSSVSHMGYVVLGIGVWTATAGNGYDYNYWSLGMSGAMFQMIAHGISSAGMFFLVGVVYDRVHHRNLDQFGGLFPRMPVYSGLAFGIFFAALGLPGLCGFIGEAFVVFSVWNYSAVLAVISAAVVILTAGYILWTLQRVYLGPEYRGPHPEALVPATRREIAIAAPLLALAIVFGVYPNALLRYMTPTIEKTVSDLATWTRDVHDGGAARKQPTSAVSSAAGAADGAAARAATDPAARAAARAASAEPSAGVLASNSDEGSRP